MIIDGLAGTTFEPEKRNDVVQDKATEERADVEEESEKDGDIEEDGDEKDEDEKDEDEKDGDEENGKERNGTNREDNEQKDAEENLGKLFYFVDMKMHIDEYYSFSSRSLKLSYGYRNLEKTSCSTGNSSKKVQ